MRVDAGPIVTLRSTLLANNGAGFNCGAPTASTPYTSNGNNLSSDNSCSPFLINSPGDDPHNASAPLGPLADNGGNTFTRALLPVSLAVDADSNAGCPNIDQRGTARPYDVNGDAVAVCDIGAYETITTTLTNMLSLTKTGSGTGSVSTAGSTINCGPTCTFQSHSYPTGTVVSLSASPESGSTFTGWSGGGCSTIPTCTLVMNSTQAVTADFAPSGYAAQVLQDSPLAYWRLGEASGSAALLDGSGNAHHSTYVGGVTLGGPGALADANSSATFDGLGYAQITSTALDVTGTGLMLETWFTAQAASNRNDGLI